MPGAGLEPIDEGPRMGRQVGYNSPQGRTEPFTKARLGRSYPSFAAGLRREAARVLLGHAHAGRSCGLAPVGIASRTCLPEEL